MQRVLALDVAFAHLGWAIIEPYKNQDVVTHVGCIDNKSDPKKKKTLLASNYTADRVAKVYQELSNIYDEYKPHCIVAELPTGGGKSMKAVEGMSLGMGIVVCLVTANAAAAQWTTPNEGKIAMCRSKTASKLDMQSAAMDKFPELREMVPKSKDKKSQSGLEGWFEHSADAVAAYLAARRGSLVRYLAEANGEYDPDPVLF